MNFEHAGRVIPLPSDMSLTDEDRAFFRNVLTRLHDTKLDQAIRVIVYEAGEGGRYDKHFTFTCKDGTVLDLEAIFGAGVNGTHVLNVDKCVYKATDVGQVVETFHDGPWVDEVCEAAKVILAEQEKRRRAEAIAAKDELLAQYSLPKTKGTSHVPGPTDSLPRSDA